MDPQDNRYAVDRRQFLYYMGGLAGATLLAGCGASRPDDGSEAGGAQARESGAPSSKGPRAVSAGIANSWQALDPHVAAGVGTISLNNHIFESLFRLDGLASEAVTPGLAADMPEQLDDRTYRVRLRQAQFHDGSPVTSADVIFSFERIADPEMGSLLAGFTSIVEDITAIDDHTVEFTFQFPTTLALQRLALPAIMSRDVVETSDERSLAEGPVGTGPFAVASVVSNESVVLVRNESYNGPTGAAADEVRYQYLPEGAARVAALVGGRVDAIEDLPYNDVASVDARLAAATVPSYSQSLMLFNNGKEPFTDKRVRQAILYAIDRDAITESVFQGEAVSAKAVLHDIHPDTSQPSIVYTRDLDKARQLLDEAGLSSGFSFELLVSNLDWIGPQAPIMESSLQDIGLDVSIRLGETESLYANVIDGSFDAYLAFDDTSALGSSDAQFILQWLYTGFLRTGLWYWDTPEAREIEEQILALRQVAEAERPKAVAQVLDRLAHEVPIYPVHQRNLPTGWNPETLPSFKPSRLPGIRMLEA